MPGSQNIWVQVLSESQLISNFGKCNHEDHQLSYMQNIFIWLLSRLGVTELSLSRLQGLDLGLGSTCLGQIYCCHCNHVITVNTSACIESYQAILYNTLGLFINYE